MVTCLVETRPKSATIPKTRPTDQDNVIVRRFSNIRVLSLFPAFSKDLHLSSKSCVGGVMFVCVGARSGCVAKNGKRE
jgi:hypothetical protein